MINKKFLLAGRPVGRPISDDDFEYKEEEVREINNGEVLLENMVIEFQPAQKGWMENISNYVAPLEIGDIMRCSGIARVLNSKSEKFKKGDIVSGGDYYIDGAQQPTLELLRGFTYTFDQSAGTNSTHPIALSTTSDGTHNGGSQYTSGWSTNGGTAGTDLRPT